MRSQVHISSKTKRSISTAVQNGEQIADFYFSLLGNDKEFTKTLIEIAEKFGNAHFISALTSQIKKKEPATKRKRRIVIQAALPPAQRKRQSKQQPRAKKNTSKSKKRLTPNERKLMRAKPRRRHVPAGKPVEDYIKDHNIHLYPPGYKFPTASFVSGGLPGLGKK